jgi:hypothetical protein
MKTSLHFETVPVAVVRKIAKPLPRRSGSPLSATRRLSPVVKARVHRPLISRKGN